MGTARRSEPLRRTGSLLGLLGLELAAVLALHWLGRFAGLRIGWDEPVEWLLSSPVQAVLGAVLRTVGLVMAYWLLASTVLYLLASLTRLPAAVRAVSWATLPLARRVADHAVAVTLATSMVGTGTLGVAGPALAADGRGGMAGPPGSKPVAAAQATSSTGAQDTSTSSAGEATPPSPPSYVPEAADQAPDASAPEETTPPPTPAAPTEPTGTVYTPDPAGREPRRLPAPGQASSTASTEAPTPRTQPPASTAGPATTAATTTSTAGLRDPVYPFDPATTTTVGPRGGAGDPGSGDQEEPGGPAPDEPTPEAGGETSREKVVEGDTLWTIAEANMPGEPTTQEVADYVDQVAGANRDRLRSGDPDLIEPGETIILPAGRRSSRTRRGGRQEPARRGRGRDPLDDRPRPPGRGLRRGLQRPHRC